MATFNPASVTVPTTATGVNMYRGKKPAAYVNNTGENRMMQQAVNKTAWGNLTGRLFIDDATVDEGAFSGTECSAAGYATVELDGTWWVTEDFGSAVITHETITFEPTEAVTVYGAYFTYGSQHAWVQKFAAPVVLGAGGGGIAVVPELKCGVVAP